METESALGTSGLSATWGGSLTTDETNAANKTTTFESSCRFHSYSLLTISLVLTILPLEAAVVIIVVIYCTDSVDKLVLVFRLWEREQPQ